ncbi:MAG: efflux RND transporter periplasmic adaptor subunit [Chitinophagia bacterium]|nr:efflux RND transporter periplasmic adaptor subunit [Chitinophagia bacterium]
MKTSTFFIASILLLVSCSSKNESKPVELSKEERIVLLTSAQVKNAGIETGKLEQREISSILKVNGKIDVPPQNLVSISVPSGGYLKTTQLLPGMRVNKGQVIAVIQDQQYIQLQQDYLTAKARIGYLENEFKRQKELNQSQASSDKQSQLSEVEYRSQRVLITALEAKLDLLGIGTEKISETNILRSINILSPINGFVSKVNVNIGKYVSPTDVLFELINPLDVHLNLKVFEKSLDKLFIGQHLVTYTNNYPNKKYPCEIILIGKEISAEGNTEVHCHFEVYDKSLVPGTFMNAEIEVKNKKSISLPVDAVVRFEGKQYIYQSLGGNKFEMVQVELGESENEFTEILLPVNSNLVSADFVTKGAYSLLMTMKNKME